jgi:hypothetical protein
MQSPTSACIFLLFFVCFSAQNTKLHCTIARPQPGVSHSNLSEDATTAGFRLYIVQRDDFGTAEPAANNCRQVRLFQNTRPLRAAGLQIRFWPKFL